GYARGKVVNLVIRHVLVASVAAEHMPALAGLRRRGPGQNTNGSLKVSTVAHQEGALDEQAGTADGAAGPGQRAAAAGFVGRGARPRGKGVRRGPGAGRDEVVRHVQL